MPSELASDLLFPKDLGLSGMSLRNVTAFGTSRRKAPSAEGADEAGRFFDLVCDSLGLSLTEEMGEQRDLAA